MMKPAREVFELQPLEIIYLTALMKENGCPGIEVDLERESERTQRSLMDVQMKSLEAKGYLEIDFMGLARVNDVLQRFIKVSSNCKSYLSQYVLRNNEKYQILYFIQDDMRFELEYRPENNTYKLQEIYALHELIFQVIERFPLVPDNKRDDDNSPRAIDEELQLATWAEQSLQEGAVIASIAEIQCISLETQVIRELILIVHEDHMRILQQESEDQIRSTSVNLITAIDAVCLWLQVA